MDPNRKKYKTVNNAQTPIICAGFSVNRTALDKSVMTVYKYCDNKNLNFNRKG